MGHQLGGFTSLQVAKLRPPHLRAILPMYATDDRYRDDVHIRGGCVTASEKCQYAVSQLGMNAMPPLPAFRGDAWRDEWRERLDADPARLFAWIREQSDGPYWRRGSLAPDYGALECAVFRGGRLERLLRGSRVPDPGALRERAEADPRRQLGPFLPGRRLPGAEHGPAPRDGPLLRPLPEGHRERWEHEPAVTWFEHEWAAPEAFPREWPGRWRAAGALPVPGTVPLELNLARDVITGEGNLSARPWLRDPDRDTAPGEEIDRLAHRATVGTAGALSWGAGWHPNGLARDLRPDELRGLTYTTPPLGEALSVIGIPEAILHVSASMPVATCVVRLSEVSPDGVSSLVATGVLNLTHRRSDTDPEPMPCGPGDPVRPEEVRIPLRATGYRFTEGHRIRLTVLTGYWPVLWPSPDVGELRVHHGPLAPSRLVLPVLPSTTADAAAASVQADTGGPARCRWWRGGARRLADRGGRHRRHRGRHDRRGRREHPRGRVSRLCLGAPGAHGIRREPRAHWPGHRRGVSLDGARLRRGHPATGEIASDEAAFEVRVDLDVRLDDEPFFAREWSERIPRHLV